MQYHIDGLKLRPWAEEKITPDTITTNASALAGFYCNLVFSFIENNYISGGFIATQKTRSGIRKYLAQKKKPVSLSGGLCKDYFNDLHTCGLAFLEEGKVVLRVPEELVNKGQVQTVAKAIRLISAQGWMNLTTEYMEQVGTTIEAVVEAMYSIEQLTTNGKDKATLKTALFKNIAKNDQPNTGAGASKGAGQ